MERSLYDRVLAVLSGIEFWSGAGLLAWGIWVQVDAAALAEMPSYDPISMFVPDAVWVGLSMAVGVGQMSTCWTAWLRWRCAGAFAAMLLYKVLAVSIMNSPAPGPGSMIFCAWAFANLAVLLRLAR